MNNYFLNALLFVAFANAVIGLFLVIVHIIRIVQLRKIKDDFSEFRMTLDEYHATVNELSIKVATFESALNTAIAKVNNDTAKS